MMFHDLPGFLEELEKSDLLDTVACEVDPILEITEITDRVSKKHGRALKFTHVIGSAYPLVINTMGTYQRLRIGLGVETLDDTASRISGLLDLRSYATWKGKLRAIPKLAPLVFVFPRKVRKAACQEIIEEPDLDSLPILQCWPGDGGRFLTLPLVFTRDPETGQQNTGMYRLQVYDKKTTGMHWHLHKDGKAIYEKYRKLGRKMPVSVALGCDPATIYAATAPLPKMIDEMIFAGFLRKKPVRLVKCVTNDLYVPADAEFVLEGYVDLDERRMEGPFGDHTGYYSLPDLYPVFHIEKMTRKRHPVYPATIVGKPPMEDCYLGKATERIFLPLLQFQCPELADLDFPLEGVFHNCAIVSIRKAFPLHGNKALSALWGLGQMMYTKMIIVVDATVNVHDYREVLKAILQNVTAKSHLVLSEGPLDALDHASDRAFQGFRLGLDATVKLPLEQTGKAPDVDSFFILSPKEPLPLHLEHPSIDQIRNADPFKIDEIPFIRIRSFSKKDGARPMDFLRSIAANPDEPNWVVLLDEWIDPADLSTAAWKVFNNIDPLRDICIETRPDGALFVGVDATKKGPEDGLSRPWPDDIEMSPSVIQKVNARWSDYGIRDDS